MRTSHFWRLMDDEFGVAYSRVLARDLVLTRLGGHSVVDALDTGADPREVWLAVCDAQDVPESRRLGRDIPPRR
ncbi:DUF3046 domain-containing protein [Tersicoccus sp. Bi-70]|uniref:DUF3046 domain-containing protein n=1 Tax=Tersicoccus sp. Bi-70 TaxID=1897634 RepID=UPI0009773AF3|nr:DUF3046 domain-containing protein [Tersicoccus sp. Bi-70]OMH31182.1 histidine kinase [Tersicoccus sp. Bi-70]